MSSPVRALIFDMDGTMVDSMPAHALSWESFARRHGIALPVDEILRRTTGRNGVECIRELMGLQVPEDQALALIAEKEAVYRERFSRDFREVPGFRAFLAQARQRGLPVAVATAGDRHNIAFTLEHLALELPPEVIVGGDEGLPGKPQPDLFLEAARRLGVPSQACVVFEDAPFGIEAARRAGMRVVGLSTTHAADDLQGSHVLMVGPDYFDLEARRCLDVIGG